MAKFLLEINDTEDGGLYFHTEIDNYGISGNLSTNSPAQNIAILVLITLNQEGVGGNELKSDLEKILGRKI